jgi:cytochrome c5
MTHSSKLLSALLIALALTACGKKEGQPAIPAQPAIEAAKPEVQAASDVQHEKGEKVFKGTCAMCHKTGASGAPIIGNKADWAPRIAQGMPTLYEHALKGFTGKKGAMPAKGANPSLSDDDVKAGVDYMVSKVK